LKVLAALTDATGAFAAICRSGRDPALAYY
jgi:hypothetical protein